MRGKLIVIEGTDCSGKDTQSKLLLKRLSDIGIKVYEDSFPKYDTPTGKIIGGSYLGKEHIGPSLFKEGAALVDPKVASLYFAADRRYNIKNIINKLDAGYNVILDRYVYSNMAHQGGKIKDSKERLNMYAWLDVLEFKLLELPKPDIAIFLSMPVSYSVKLRENRKELPDSHESNIDYLEMSFNAYQELANNYKWDIINCVDNDTLKEVSAINDELFDLVINKL